MLRKGSLTLSEAAQALDALTSPAGRSPSVIRRFDPSRKRYRNPCGSHIDRSRPDYQRRLEDIAVAPVENPHQYSDPARGGGGIETSASAFFPQPAKAEAQPRTIPKDVLEMVKHAGLVSNEDVAEAAKVANEESTDLAKRLVALGKLEPKTLLAARQCLSLIESDRLRLDRAIIALQYCHRSRVGFYEAVEEMGWERP